MFIRPPGKEMKGLERGRLYLAHHSHGYDADRVDADVIAPRADSAVGNRRGIYEYLLGGKVDHKLLAVRVFDDKTKAARYEQQTTRAEAAGLSNCPLCALGDNANRTRIYKLTEVDADHVTAWSHGGATDITNCEMLCATHNRTKGNR